MKQIHAISLNTAIDIRIVLPQFALGTVIRSENYTEFTAGKAVNNARAIACLGRRVSLYCLCGMNEVPLFSATSPLIEAHIMGVEGMTRRNLTLVSKNAELICHVQNQGYHVSAPNLNRLEQLLVSKLGDGDIVIISGSVPIGTPENYLNQLIKEIAKYRVRILLDVDPSLLRTIDCRVVEIVKPNLEELKLLANRDITSIDNIVAAATDLIMSHVVVVSLGDRGALWIDRDKRCYTLANSLSRGNGRADVIGCGDSMIGGFAFGLAEGMASRDVLKVGISAGYANMFVEGPGILSVDHYKHAFNSIKVGPPMQY